MESLLFPNVDVAALRARGRVVLPAMAGLYETSDVSRRAQIASAFYALGWKSPEAKRVLMEEVVEDDLNAQTEIDRYTFRSPGQATAYYYGYENMQALRARTEMHLKEAFDQKAFHDFILAQGLLPPEVLNDAVEQEFVAPRLSE